MENTKYTELKEHLTNVLKTAKKLGLSIEPGGGYTMGYDINNLPPYPVGLFGALSIVEGPGARCKLGLTFDETESLESGFNCSYPNTKNKKKKKKRNFKPDTELIKLGTELSSIFLKPHGFGSKYGGVTFSDYGSTFPAYPVHYATGATVTTSASTVVGTFSIPYEQQKQKIMDNMMGLKFAQAAPSKEELIQKMIKLTDALAGEVKVLQEDIADNGG